MDINFLEKTLFVYFFSFLNLNKPDEPRDALRKNWLFTFSIDFQLFGAQQRYRTAADRCCTAASSVGKRGKM